MKKIYCSLVLLTLVFTATFSQQYCFEKIFSFGKNSSNGSASLIHDVCYSPSGNYIVVASHRGGKFFEISKQGETLQEKLIPYVGEKVIPVPMGYLVGGDIFSTSSTAQYDRTVCLLLDNAGDTIWTFTPPCLINSSDIWYSGLAHNPDNQRIAFGSRACITQLNYDGSIVRQKNFSVFGFKYGISQFFQNTDGSYSLFGSGANNKVLMVNLTSDLDLSWSKNIAVSNYTSDLFDRYPEQINHNLTTGHYLIVERAYEGSVRLNCINSQGDLIFAKNYPNGIQQANWYNDEIRVTQQKNATFEIERLAITGNALGTQIINLPNSNRRVLRNSKQLSPSDLVMYGTVQNPNDIDAANSFLWLSNCVTHTKEADPIMQLRVFPNPLSASQMLHLAWDNNLTGTLKIEILSIDGRILEVFFEEKTSPSMMLSRAIADRSGLFFLRVSDKKTSVTRMVRVQE